MLGPVSFVIFAAVIVIVMAVIYAFSGGSAMMSDRLGRLWSPAGPQRVGIKESRQQVVGATLSWVSKIFPSTPEQAAKADPRLVQAGFRRPEAASAFRAAKVIVIASLLAIVFISGYWRGNPIIWFLIAGVLGFMLPDIWLSRKVSARQRALRLALPDALDLLVICMEAGLGLDQALLYVGQELRIAHPELCEEFDLVNAEMQMGKNPAGCTPLSRHAHWGRRRSGIGCYADSDRPLWHQRVAIAAYTLRRSAHQAPAAR